MGITLYGEGLQTRSFCYIDDVVDGLIRVMNSDAEFTGSINRGHPAEFSLKQLAELVIVTDRLAIAYRLLPFTRQRTMAAEARHHPREGNAVMVFGYDTEHPGG